MDAGRKRSNAVVPPPVSKTGVAKKGNEAIAELDEWTFKGEGGTTEDRSEVRDLVDRALRERTPGTRVNVLVPRGKPLPPNDLRERHDFTVEYDAAHESKDGPESSGPPPTMSEMVAANQLMALQTPQVQAPPVDKATAVARAYLEGLEKTPAALRKSKNDPAKKNKYTQLLNAACEGAVALIKAVPDAETKVDLMKQLGNLMLQKVMAFDAGEDAERFNERPSLSALWDNTLDREFSALGAHAAAQEIFQLMSNYETRRVLVKAGVGPSMD
ncbi:MAG TPA: hypothetical protein VL593_18115 [Ramlibacter sp.]|nr:hypothetical protein [Ramlibacter sp.]